MTTEHSKYILDIAKARRLIAILAEESALPHTHVGDVLIEGTTMGLAAILPAALDRIEQLQVALSKACDIIDCYEGVGTQCPVVAIADLRALAGGEVTDSDWSPGSPNQLRAEENSRAMAEEVSE